MATRSQLSQPSRRSERTGLSDQPSAVVSGRARIPNGHSLCPGSCEATSPLEGERSMSNRTLLVKPDQSRPPRKLLSRVTTRVVLALGVACFVASVVPAATATAATAAISGPTKPSGAYYGSLLQNANSGLCMDSNGGATGPRMHQWTCDWGNVNQVYMLTAYYDPYTGSYDVYTIRNRAYNECVDVPNASLNNGVQLQLWPCNGTGAQFFRLYAGSLINWNSGKCVDVLGWSGQNGGIIDQWTCGNQANQHWNIYSWYRSRNAGTQTPPAVRRP